MTSKWPTFSLAELCDVKRGETITRSQTTPGKVPVIAGGLKPAYFHATSNRPSGAITVSGSGANAGSVAMWDEEIWASDCSTVISKNEKLLQQFVYYYLKANESFIKTKLRQGAAQPHVYAKDLAVLEIPLPPLDEQKRIVAKLDEMLANVDELEKKSQAAIHEIYALTNSTLDSLTELNETPRHFLELKKCTSKIGSGATPRGGHKNYKRSGISLIRSLNVLDLNFRKDQLAYIDELQAEKLSNVTVQADDVLLNITGASIARTCIVPKEILPARVNQHVSIVRPIKEKLLPDFLALQLAAPRNKNRLLGIGVDSGATRQALTKQDIENFQIEIPEDLAQQQAVIEKYYLISDLIQILKTNLIAKIKAAYDLRTALLSDAFAGEL